MSKPTCCVVGCERDSRRRGYCGMHYARVLRDGDPGPAGSMLAELNAPCVVCGEIVKPGNQRRKHCSGACQAVDSRTKGQRATSYECKLCRKTIDIARRTNARFQRADSQWCRDCGRSSPDAMRYKKYGVTPEQYSAALLTGCQLCGEVVAVLHIDHDHSCCDTGYKTCGDCVRGFLCGNCNRGLGIFRDDVNLLKAAVAYLAT